MSLKDFITAVKTDGIMYTNRFSVQFSVPQEVQSVIGFNKLRTVLLFCDQAQLPGVNLSSSQVRIFGEMQESPYEKLYDPLNLSFLVDNDLRVKMLFDAWLNYIQSGVSRNFRYLDEYSTNITINVYDRKDKLRFSTTLYKAFPKTINMIALDYASRDVMRLPVTFSYKYYSNNIVLLDGRIQPNPDNFMASANNEFKVFKSDISMNMNNYIQNFDEYQNSLFDQPQTFALDQYGKIDETGITNE